MAGSVGFVHQHMGIIREVDETIYAHVRNGRSDTRVGGSSTTPLRSVVARFVDHSAFTHCCRSLKKLQFDSCKKGQRCGLYSYWRTLTFDNQIGTLHRRNSGISRTHLQVSTCTEMARTAVYLSYAKSDYNRHAIACLRV